MTHNTISDLRTKHILNVSQNDKKPAIQTQLNDSKNINLSMNLAYNEYKASNYNIPFLKLMVRNFNLAFDLNCDVVESNNILEAKE